MPRHASGTSNHRLVGAAVLSGALCAVAVLAVGWGRLVSTGRAPTAAGDVVFSTVYAGALATVLFTPFLLAVLLIVADPSLPAVVGGAGLVYVVDLLVTAWQSPRVGVQSGFDLAVLAVPLPRVATVLAIATGVWLAYHGGYDRFAAAVDDADQHPLFALVSDRPIGPALSLQRGLVVAGLAGSLGAGGTVLAGWVGDALQAIARPGPTEVARVVVRPTPLVDVGIPLDQLPTQWLEATSFLLAVLLVTGPRLQVRDHLKGLAVVIGVQGALVLLTVTEQSSTAFDLVVGTRAALTPLEDVILLTGIAVAVWLTYHGGFETLEHRTRSVTFPE